MQFATLRIYFATPLNRLHALLLHIFFSTSVDEWQIILCQCYQISEVRPKSAMALIIMPHGKRKSKREVAPTDNFFWDLYLMGQKHKFLNSKMISHFDLFGKVKSIRYSPKLE